VEIQWLGQTTVQIAGEAGVVLLDPPETGPSGRLAQATIVTFSRAPTARAGSRPSSTPFAIYGPGEYEVGGVFVIGVRVPGPPPESEERHLVTAYCVSMESLTVCNLGPVHRPPTQEQVEALGSVDVLLLPVGGGGTLTPRQAVEVVNSVEPTLIVPMLYRTAAEPEREPVTRFLEEMGVTAPETVPQLVVSRAKLPLERQVVLLAPAEPTSE
jgi:L-ascorbate metabolism protein UlaG (beta-lactamase superfamily)